MSNTVSYVSSNTDKKMYDFIFTRIHFQFDTTAGIIIKKLEKI